MAQIPMECPRCKRWGSVPSNKINTPLTCKKCGAGFYLNPQGLAILGLPPGSRPDPAEAKKKKPEFGDVDFKVDVGALWRDLDPAQRQRFLGLAAAIVLIVGAGYLYASMPTTDYLTESALDVARAVADDNESRISSLAAEGTSEDATLWIKSVRARYGIRGSSDDFKMSASLMAGGGTSDKAQVLATLATNTPGVLGPPKSEAKSKGATSSADAVQVDTDMVPLNLYFLMDRRGHWRLDGSDTLKSFASQRKKPGAG
jgi:hypothetical protein